MLCFLETVRSTSIKLNQVECVLMKKEEQVFFFSKFSNSRQKRGEWIEQFVAIYEWKHKQNIPTKLWQHFESTHNLCACAIYDKLQWIKLFLRNECDLNKDKTKMCSKFLRVSDIHWGDVLFYFINDNDEKIERKQIKPKNNIKIYWIFTSVEINRRKIWKINQNCLAIQHIKLSTKGNSGNLIENASKNKSLSIIKVKETDFFYYIILYWIELSQNINIFFGHHHYHHHHCYY
jgi:hypothetical protein